MVKFRLLLVAATAVSLMLFVNFYYWNILHNLPVDDSPQAVVSMILMFPAPFMLLSSLIMLAFSFLKVEEQGGRLVYDARNPYWRIMSRIYSWNESVSLCEAFWLTVWTVFIVSVVSFVAVMIIMIVRSGRAMEVGWLFLKAVGSLSLLLGGVAVFAVFAGWLVHLAKSKYRTVCYFAYVILTALVLCMVGTFVYAIIQSGHYLFFTFLILSVALLLIYENKLQRILADNALMQIYYALKNHLCPILVSKTQAE